MKKHEKIIFAFALAFIFFVFSFFFMILYDLRPFKTEAEKETKPFYYTATDHLSMDLDMLGIYIEENELVFQVYVKDYKHDTFTYDMVKQCNQVMQQALAYSNSSQNDIRQYDKITFRFQANVGHTSSSLDCTITKSDKMYSYTNCFAIRCCSLGVLGAMTEAKHIDYEGGEIEKQIIDPLSNLTSLEELTIDSYSEPKDRERILNSIKVMLPKCKVLWKNDKPSY